jgi:hypothetical protein
VKDLFDCISRAELEIVVQLEAIMQRLAELALVKSQSGSTLSSTMYILLRIAYTRMNTYKFFDYCLDGVRDGNTNEKKFPQVQLLMTNLSDLAHRCIERTRHQIIQWLPRPSIDMGMALLLDPRTKTAAKNYLRIPDSPEAATDKIVEATKALMRIEHRVFYKAMNADSPHGADDTASAPSSPRDGSNSSSDTDANLVYGGNVAQPDKEIRAEDALDAKADEILEEWFSLRIDWADVLRRQCPNQDEYEKILAKLTVRDRKRKVRVWNVEQLCAQIDVCRWFNEVGESKYPSVCKVARVWLGRDSSTAFQERVFSTGSFLMSSLRTRTDNERAQRQLILRQNRLELMRMEESKHQLW